MFSGEQTQYTQGCQHCGWDLKMEYTGETLTAVPRFDPPKTTNVHRLWLVKYHRVDDIPNPRVRPGRSN